MNILFAGASSGIGRFLAERLARAGHHVWGFARSTENVSPHSRVRAFTCDVAEWNEVNDFASRIAPEISPLSAIIICAAVQGPIGPAMSVDPRTWSAAIRINLEGTFNVLRAFVSQLHPEKGRRAKVLCFSGGGATKSRPNFSAYAAAKTGVVRLVETLADEWRLAAIDINAIAPGALRTRMTEEILRAGSDLVDETEIVTARVATEAGKEDFERLGRLVDFLLGAESDGISGKLISAVWDPWEKFSKHRDQLRNSDLLTLRRITLPDGGDSW